MQEGRQTDLKGLGDMGAQEGLLGGPRGLESVVLAGAPLLVLRLKEAGHQALHPLMHPHIGPLPPLPVHPHASQQGLGLALIH